MGIGMGIFRQAVGAWGLTPDEVYGLVGEVQGDPTHEQIQKIDLVNSIYLHLRSLPPDQARLDARMRLGLGPDEPRM